jgi:protein SCO1/2
MAAALLMAGMAAGQILSDRQMSSGPADIKPPQLQNVSIEQRLNEQIPLDLNFADEDGKPVRLGQVVGLGPRPVILSLVYYDCPMLCGEVLNGMASALGVLKFNIGEEYEVVTVSFDPRETPAQARNRKETTLHRLGRRGAQRGWHFLTGKPEAISALANAVGFHYQWDPQAQQYAHAAAIMVLTPQGKIAQYFYGVEYSPKDIRLALIEASQNRIGNVVDQLLLYCYHYDPRTGRYSAIVTNVLRVAAVLTVLVLSSLLIVMFRMGPRPQRSATGGRR